MSIISTKFSEKYLLQRRTAMPECFASLEKYLYNAELARHTASADLRLQAAHLDPRTLSVFKICCPSISEILERVSYQIRCKNPLTVTSNASRFADLIKFRETVL